MEELQSRHRKELRDLQSQVTQKKKQASKKTRKAVNEECEQLERELKERQEREVKKANGEIVNGDKEDGVEDDLEALTLKVDEDETPSTNGTPQTADDTSSNGTSEPGKKRNRQKDRLARRAAEQAALAEQAASEAQDLPDLKELERTRMLASMKAHNLREVEIRADGHCLYSAVADQLKYLDIPMPTPSTDGEETGKGEEYRSIRAAAASWITSHPSDFEPFLEEPLNDYVYKVRDTAEWGGQVELLALARTLETDICVLQDYGRVERIEGVAGVKGKEEKKEMWLGYYKHGFGLGEHYNSLRKVKKEGG